MLALYDNLSMYLHILLRVYKIVRNIRCVYRFCFLFFFFLSFPSFLTYRLAHALNSALSFSRRIIIFKYSLTYLVVAYIQVENSSNVVIVTRYYKQKEEKDMLHTPIFHHKLLVRTFTDTFRYFYLFFFIWLSRHNFV